MGVDVKGGHVLLWKCEKCKITTNEPHAPQSRCPSCGGPWEGIPFVAAPAECSAPNASSKWPHCYDKPQYSDSKGNHRCADYQPVPASSSQPAVPIYFDGAEGTGKTQMARRVSEDYGLPMIDEVARLVLSVYRPNTFEGVRADARTSSAFQAEVLRRQLADEALHKLPFVADRTMGNLAYARAHALNFADLFDSVPEDYKQRLRSAVVFLVRPQESFREAAKRDPGRLLPDWEGQVRIDETIGTIFKIWRVKYVRVEMPGDADRTEFVDYILAARGFRRVR